MAVAIRQSSAYRLAPLVGSPAKPCRAGVAPIPGPVVMALGLADIGTIRPGAAANLVVIDGDPAADIRLLTERERIWLVMVAGHPIAGRALAPAPLTASH